MKNIKNYTQFINENATSDVDINDLVEGIFNDIKEKFDISNFKKKANNIGVLEYEYKTSKDDKIKITSDSFFIENDKVEIDKKLFDKIRQFFNDIATKEPELLSDKKYSDIVNKYKNKYIKKDIKEVDDKEEKDDVDDEISDDEDTSTDDDEENN